MKWNALQYLYIFVDGEIYHNTSLSLKDYTWDLSGGPVVRDMPDNARETSEGTSVRSRAAQWESSPHWLQLENAYAAMKSQHSQS